MYFEKALHSKVSSLEVASIVDAFVKQQIDTGYFELVAIDAGKKEHTLLIRPILEQIFVLETDESQSVKCVTRDGREVELLFPPIDLRSVRPAGVLIGIEPLPSAPTS